MSFNWKVLQNGSDIRGISVEGIEGEEVNLDKDRIEQLGKAFYHWLRKKFSGDINIAVGMDSRISGPELLSGFSQGVSSQGGNVIDCGLASTPAMFMATLSTDLKAQAGVMLTASHLPYNRNGLKFFTSEGGLNKSDISEILAIAAENSFEDAAEKGSYSQKDFISEYAATIVEAIRKRVDHNTNFHEPLDGLKIIVDAGNGAGGFFADKILVPLGADVSGSQFLDPDGMFPNHIPNPENEAAMDSICNTVRLHNADLGIIFDTDVDRAAVVDKEGMPINRNALIALISAIILEEHPGSTVVTDSITSEGLTQFIELKLGGIHHRFKRGYKNVINESVRLNDMGEESWIAIETSGHAALKENYFLDDGAYLVAKILVKVAQLHRQGENVSQLIKELSHPLESVEYRLSIKDKDFTSYGEDVISQLNEMIADIENWQPEKVNHEGIRVRCSAKQEQGWFLLRMSLHDPVMPLNIESDIKGGAEKIKNKLKNLLLKFDQIDYSSL
jgi:phosphomannomutase